jgi:cytochrome c553
MDSAADWAVPVNTQGNFTMTMRHKDVLLVMIAISAIIPILGCAAEESSSSATTPSQSVSSSTDSSSTVGNGKTQFVGLGCSACHSIGSDTVVGPGLSNIRTKGDQYILESIVDPKAILVPDFQDLMPESFGSVNESDLNDLVSYLKTLK